MSIFPLESKVIFFYFFNLSEGTRFAQLWFNKKNIRIDKWILNTEGVSFCWAISLVAAVMNTTEPK